MKMRMSSEIESLVEVFRENYFGTPGATWKTALEAILDDISTAAMFTDENIEALETTYGDLLVATAVFVERLLDGTIG